MQLSPKILAGIVFLLLAAPFACAQADPTFCPQSLTIRGLKLDATITVTSPYFDCTMAITVLSSNPAVADINPKGPIVDLGPVKFTVTSGLKAGTAIITFQISSSPSGCVARTIYTIPVTVIDPGAVPPPRYGGHDKQVLEPVTMGNGVYLNNYTDLSLRGPIPLEFARYYYSALGTEGVVSSALGPNWMHNFDLSFKTDGSATASVNWYEGQLLQFTGSGGTWTQSTTDEVRYQLVQSGTTYRLLDPASNRVYTFNGANGQLQTIQDRNGNTQTLTYNSTGQLASVADGFGGTLNFQYTSGNLTRVSDNSNRSVSFGYSGGALTSFTDANSRATVYNYTSSGSLMTAATLARGNVPSTTAYDSNGCVSSQKDAAGNSTAMSFNTSTGTSTMTDPLGQTSQYTHVNRNLTQESSPAGNTINNTYDSNSRLLTQRDPNGRLTSYTYQTSTGLLSTVTYPDGTQFTRTLTAVPANGLTYYDMTSASFQDGTTESYQCDANGNLTLWTDRAGQQWKATYNSHGQPLVITAPNGSKQTNVYSSDAASLLTSITIGDDAAETIAYDALRRPASHKYSDGTSRAFTYDPYDHVAAMTDETGAVTTYTYDANGLLATIKDPTGGVTTIARTGTDKVASTTDAAQRGVTFKYDQLDRPLSATLTDGSVLQAAYDPAGNVVSTTDGEGKVWKTAYDAAGTATVHQSDRW